SEAHAGKICRIMDMAMQNIGFRDAYQSFSTVKTFAPIAQSIDGRFNTTLSIAGILGRDMTPDFSTLSAAGFLETLNAIVNNFKPLNEIGTKLNLNYMNKLELKNTRNWFEIKNGMVTVKPFNVQMQDVAMQIGGSHGLASDMSYQILTKVPRSALEKSGLGSAANSGLNLLSSEASKMGVNIAQGEFINVRFDVTGTYSNPKLAMKVLGSDGQATIKDQASATAGAAYQQAKDSITHVVNQKVEEAKDKAREAAQKAEDSLRNLANQKAEEAKRKAEEEAKKALGNEGQKKVDDVKDKLNKWDPFNKKKKD
ncbi:MAG TPA: AsmA-like C-terminal region-containing protein, partial [Saprospiraceae bacterium]|nr:AsmA-like C-terminal region-containing protein [Saprospiraceae bacterium]